ncbi:hypothetical protein Q1695_010670 [Nippostrongylus brasiliensis]|nr:hypothetical protein Q1695_010670 [Nippostrongylus brasiliensis]
MSLRLAVVLGGICGNGQILSGSDFHPCELAMFFFAGTSFPGKGRALGNIIRLADPGAAIMKYVDEELNSTSTTFHRIVLLHSNQPMSLISEKREERRRCLYRQCQRQSSSCCLERLVEVFALYLRSNCYSPLSPSGWWCQQFVLEPRNLLTLHNG